MLSRARPQANCLSRHTVETVLAMSQKSMRDLRNWSLTTSTLPPGQKEKGTVTMAHPSRHAAIFISRVTRLMGRPAALRSRKWAMAATHATSSAMRKVASAGNADCGDKKRMDMKIMSAQNATPPPALSRRMARPGSNAGRDAGRRHQSEADPITALRLRSRRLGSAHVDCIIEQFDVEEPVLAKPPVHLGEYVFPLISRRVPIECVEPPPAPIGMHGNRRHLLADPA